MNMQGCELVKLNNGTEFWVCICKQLQTGSTYCASCSHKPSQLANVLRRKHFWVGQKTFIKKCVKASELDAHLKLKNIRLANEAFIAQKNLGVFGSPPVNRPRVNPRYRDIKSHYFSYPAEARVDRGTLPVKPRSSEDLIVVPAVVNEILDEDVSASLETQIVNEFPEVSVSPVTKTIVTKPARALELDPENFEWYCAEWCVYFGHSDVRVTRSTKDGGIDVHGDGFIAQVKLQELPVGVRAIRELAGLVSIRSKALGYFFTVNGYSIQAIAEANELGIAIFVVRPFQAEIIPNSEMANLIIEDAKLSSER